MCNNIGYAGEDVVLEVGCCGGTTTSIIGKHCRLVVGIDQTAAEIAIANRRFALPGKVRFEVMDAFDMAAVLRLQKDIGCQFTKVFIDINGSRDIGTICDCMDKIQKVLRPELVVVKSVKLRTLLYQCTAWDARGTESLADEERDTATCTRSANRTSRDASLHVVGGRKDGSAGVDQGLVAETGGRYLWTTAGCRDEGIPVGHTRYSWGAGDETRSIWQVFHGGCSGLPVGHTRYSWWGAREDSRVGSGRREDSRVGSGSDVGSTSMVSLQPAPPLGSGAPPSPRAPPSGAGTL